MPLLKFKRIALSECPFMTYQTTITNVSDHSLSVDWLAVRKDIAEAPTKLRRKCKTR